MIPTHRILQGGLALLFSLFIVSQNVEAQRSQQIDLMALSRSLESLAARIKPAVVQIYVTGYAVDADASSSSLLFKQRGGGSGVILDPNGYIITNAHVVEGARRIQVIISEPDTPDMPRQSILKASGRMVGAQLVGMDRATDLAVLKIPGNNLPHMPLGNSDELKPGQFVMTFGSPMGLENTVTFGVVSAVARQLNPDDPMIYVQTDAPINPGNSGGPLVDMQGRVIGINTFIFSQSGGSDGLGFAAPSNIVKNVFDQIRTTGQMRRGVIGVNAQTITPLMAHALGLSQTWGVILGDVYPDSPAETMGLMAGDIILTLDGKPMENGRQFQVNLYSRRIGNVVTLELLRETTRLTLQVPVVEQQNDPDRFASMVTPEQNLVSKLGILGLDITEEVSGMLPFLRQNEGVVVAARSAGSPIGGYMLFPGDVIHGINGNSIMDLEALKTSVGRLTPFEPVVLHIERQGQMMFIILESE